MDDKLKDKFNLFISDLKYIQNFIYENFGREKILISKNKGVFPSRNYQLKNSRIKGYAFHGYGCHFQFKDISIDVDLRFDRVGFTYETFKIYLKHSMCNVDQIEILSLLNSHVINNNLDLKEEDVYLIG